MNNPANLREKVADAYYEGRLQAFVAAYAPEDFFKGKTVISRVTEPYRKMMEHGRHVLHSDERYQNYGKLETLAFKLGVIDAMAFVGIRPAFP